MLYIRTSRCSCTQHGDVLIAEIVCLWLLLLLNPSAQIVYCLVLNYPMRSIISRSLENNSLSLYDFPFINIIFEFDLYLT